MYKDETNMDGIEIFFLSFIHFLHHLEKMCLSIWCYIKKSVYMLYSSIAIKKESPFAKSWICPCSGGSSAKENHLPYSCGCGVVVEYTRGMMWLSNIQWNHK